MGLEEYGWCRFFEEAFQEHAASGCVPGRIARASRGHYVALTKRGEMDAAASGKFGFSARARADWPVAGDWVALWPESNLIDAVLPRKSVFSRKQPGPAGGEQVLAANVDILFVVCGLDGDFNLRRLERYLLLAAEGGAAPVVVLNKADVCPCRERALAEARAIAPGVPAILASALGEPGLDALTAFAARGETAALVGSSGAGKSTIINRLLGNELLRTQAVRASDSRGRHTTTGRELFVMPGGWLLMDTPGLRELQLWAGEDSLGSTFSEIAALAARCRFRDCRHQGEPGCAVAQALDEGELDEARFGSYRKLERELSYLARKCDVRAAAEEKRRWKQIHKAQRNQGKRK